jgi:hypothetical protein
MQDIVKYEFTYMFFKHQFIFYLHYYIFVACFK